MAYVIKAAALVEPKSGQLLEKPWVVVDGDVIAETGFGDGAPAELECHDFGDAILMPGLIDSHVHLVMPGDGSDGETTLAEDDSTLFARAAGNALRALTAGVTTLRDCGGRDTLTVELRDTISAGLIPGPRIVAAGPALTHTGGHCHYFGGEVDGPDEVAKKARELFRAGADYIKMMGTGGGTAGTVSYRAYFTIEEIAAAVDTAHRLGKKVAVHVLCVEAMRRALEAGADRVEHGWFMAEDRSIKPNPAMIQRMAEASLPVTGTLGVFQHYLDVVGDSISSEERAEREQLLTETLALARAFHEAGVPLVFGTDGGWRHTPFDAPEVEAGAMASAGLSNAEVLWSATGLAAQVLGLEDEVGTIEAGKQADIVVLRANPLDDLANLATVQTVIKAGRIWREPAQLRELFV